MNKNLNKHIKSDKLKWAITGIILVLVVVMLIGMCLQLFGQGKVKPSEWFDKTDKTPVQNVEIVESENALRSSIFASTLNDSEIANTASVVDYTRYITMENKADGLTLLNSYKRGDYDENAEYTLTITSKGDTFIPYKLIYDKLYCLIGCDGFGQPVNDLRFLGIPNGLFGSTSFDFTFDCTLIFDNPEINPELVIRINSQGIGIEFGGENLSEFGSIDDIYDIGAQLLECSVSEFLIETSDNLEAFNEYTIEEKVVCETADVVPLPPIPTKEGYTFTGWYLDEACTQKYTGTTITSDTVLYAGWEINNYTVTFNSDGGSNIASQSVEYNKSANLATPTKEGYTFKGWFLADGTQYTNQAIKANTTLKAKWEIKKMSVAFNSDGGSNIVDQSVEYGKSANLTTPTKEGYTFKGWFLADGTQYTNQAIRANTTLKAKWEIKRFTVTFYVDGEVYNEMTVDYGTRLQNVADRANVFSQNIVSYRFLNAELPVGEFGNIVVVDDMEVEATAPTETDKVVGTIKNNWLPILLGGVGLIALIVIISLVATHKKRV